MTFRQHGAFQSVGGVPFVPPGLSALGTFAAAMAPGTWAQISGMINIDPVIAQAPVFHMLPYGGTGAWDPLNKKIKFVGSEGHGVANTQAEFDDATNSWSVLHGPRVDSNPSLIPYNDQHVYDHNVVNPANGEHYLSDPGGFPVPKVLRYRGGVWQSLVPYANWGSQSVGTGSCWWSGAFPQIGAQGCFMVVDFNNFGDFAYYDPLSDIWRRTSLACTPGFYHTFLEYSALKNVAVYGGGTSYSQGLSKKLWRLNANGSQTAMPDAPFPVGIYDGMLFTTEPVTGNFLAIGNGGMWELNSDGAGVWTQQTGGRAPPADVVAFIPSVQNPYPGFPPGISGGCGSILVSCSTYGVVLAINAMVAGYRAAPLTHVWAYKHA